MLNHAMSKRIVPLLAASILIVGFVTASLHNSSTTLWKGRVDHDSKVQLNSSPPPAVVSVGAVPDLGSPLTRTQAAQVVRRVVPFAINQQGVYWKTLGLYMREEGDTALADQVDSLAEDLYHWSHGRLGGDPVDLMIRQRELLSNISATRWAKQEEFSSLASFEYMQRVRQQ